MGNKLPSWILIVLAYICGKIAIIGCVGYLVKLLHNRLEYFNHWILTFDFGVAQPEGDLDTKKSRREVVNEILK